MTPPPQVPPTLSELREMFIRLPTYRRWHTTAGGDFLLMLDLAVVEHGGGECAKALGESRQNIYNWVRRRYPREPVAIPTGKELRSLKTAWAAIQIADRQRRRISRRNPAFHAIHDALAALLQKYDLDVIARELRVEPRRMKRFTGTPETIDGDVI